MVRESAQTIARLRMVGARAVIARTADLREYPYHLLTVHSTGFSVFGRHTRMTAALEILESSGWELVTMCRGDGRMLFATVRRRGGPRAE